MIQRISVLQRPTTMSVAEFRRHWRQVHGPLAAKVPGLVAYRQSHVIDSTQRVGHARGGAEIDGFAQLWFADAETMARANASPEFAAARADLPAMARAMCTYNAETNEVVAPDRNRPLAKRMTLLCAKPGMSRAEFRRHWIEDHAPLVARFPRLRGYTQHLITERLPVPSAGVADAAIDCAGILEMWFDTLADMDAAFASPEGQAGAAHGSEFLSAVTTYVVEELKIV